VQRLVLDVLEAGEAATVDEFGLEGRDPRLGLFALRSIFLATPGRDPMQRIAAQICMAVRASAVKPSSIGQITSPVACASHPRAMRSFCVAFSPFARRRQAALMGAWDELSVQLLFAADRHGVRGVAYERVQMRLLVFSDDPRRSDSVIPAAVRGFPVELLPSAARANWDTYRRAGSGAQTRR